MSELVANRYRIDSLPQRGTVFEAFDLRLNRKVAVKAPPVFTAEERSLAQQFYREAMAAARLTHPNIVAVHDVGEAGAHPEAAKTNGPDPFLVMEYIPGESLAYYLVSRQALPSEQVSDPFDRKLDFLFQVSRALHHGHEQGVIHRCINPHNILVTPSGEAKILNFGITPVTGSAPVCYMSPEQLEGKTNLERTTDVFSLGVLLYELLFGVHPFEADSDEAAKSRICTGDYSPAEERLAGCAPELTEIVDRCLARSPGDRFPDCRSLARALKALRLRLPDEKEQCRMRLSSMRNLVKNDLRSAQLANRGLIDSSLLQSTDSDPDDYEKLLRSCSQFSGAVEELDRQTQLDQLINSAEAAANEDRPETALTLLADVLKADPGNERAPAVECSMRVRKEVTALLNEAREAEESGRVAMASLLALEALNLDPTAWYAKALFDRTQAFLSERRLRTPEELTLVVALKQLKTVLWPRRTGGDSAGLERDAERQAESDLAPSIISKASRRFAGWGLSGRGVFVVLGLLLLVGAAWFVSTRSERGVAPVSASPVASAPKLPIAQQGIVSLDVAPWAKVDSIVSLNDGRRMANQGLESPCTFSLPQGRYALTVSHPEFGSRLLRVEVKAGQVNSVQQSLLPEGELEDILVESP